MRLDHTPGIYVQCRLVTGIVLSHSYRISRVPEYLNGATTLVGVREAAQEVAQFGSVRPVDFSGARAVRGIVMVSFRFVAWIVLKAWPSHEELSE